MMVMVNMEQRKLFPKQQQNIDQVEPQLLKIVLSHHCGLFRIVRLEFIS